MSEEKQKLELTWIGKEKRPRLEPRGLAEDAAKSHHAVTQNQRRRSFRRSEHPLPRRPAVPSWKRKVLEGEAVTGRLDSKADGQIDVVGEQECERMD